MATGLAVDDPLVRQAVLKALVAKRAALMRGQTPAPVATPQRKPRTISSYQPVQRGLRTQA